jgi:hypothetical protein
MFDSTNMKSKIKRGGGLSINSTPQNPATQHQWQGVQQDKPLTDVLDNSCRKKLNLYNIRLFQ